MSDHRLFCLLFRSLFIPACAALIVMAGCSSTPKHEDVCLPHYGAKRVVDENAPEGTYCEVDRVTAYVLAQGRAGGDRTLPVYLTSRSSPRPLNVLVLSGGGQYASFAGGILVGWTESGKRPAFDVVTGVSSGSFLAVYAYLGPKYDSRIKAMAYGLRLADVFDYQPLYYWFMYRSIGSSEPLKKLIEKEFNDECMADIRAAHRSGRRLFVGTMNQRTRRLVVWDVGALACSGRPDADATVRKVLLASSAIPGIVPPVDIEVEVNGVRYHEEHVDGGAVTQGFVRFGPEAPKPDPNRPGDKWLAGSHLYAIAGGKLYADTVETAMGLLKRTTSTISGTLYALYRADLWRLYSLCAVSGMRFHHAGVPADVKINLQCTSFDAATMRELFDLGQRLGADGTVWRDSPPGCEVGEEENPRAGLSFSVQ